MNEKIFGYDLECLCNCFTAEFINVDDPEDNYTFALNKYTGVNRIRAFYKFIENPYHVLYVGFNNLAYDGPLIAYVEGNKYAFIKKLLGAPEIYRKSQQYFTRQDEAKIIEKAGGKPKFYPAAKPSFDQADLQKINHYDGKGRHASLKWIMMSLGMDNIQEMPMRYDLPIARKDIPILLSYGHNDTTGTVALYHYTKKAIELRYWVQEEYGINALHMSDVSMGVRIIMRLLCKKKELTYSQLKHLRTYRTVIEVKKLMIPIAFKTSQMKRTQTFFTDLVISPKQEAKFEMTYDGVAYKMGKGGLHGAAAAGIYREDLASELIYVDATGFYPAISFLFSLFPEHLGLDFCEVIKILFYGRLAYIEKGETKKAEINKLAANGAIGQSNVEGTPVYDPAFFFGITINGQLLFLKFIEEAVRKSNAKVIMANTDGLLVQIKRTDRSKFQKVVDSWCEWTGMIVKTENWRLMVMRNVNNYLAINEDNEITQIGDFEVDKDLHKANTKKIVRLALEKYFTKEIDDVAPFIRNHTVLKDFLIGVRGNDPYRFYIQTVTRTDIEYELLGKLIRFVVTKEGSTIVKKDPRRKTGDKVCKGWNLTMAMNVTNKTIADYDIDYNYYIYEANKVIQDIEFKEPELFSELSF